MAYPDKPALDYSYTGFQQAQGDDSFPGTQVDNDLANLKTAIDETIDFVSEAFRSDGILEIAALPAGADFLEEIAAAEAAAAAAAADVVLTHADVVLTHADVVLTHADVVTAAASAATATTQAGISTTQAGISTTGAATATTQAGSATTSAATATTQAGIATAKAVLTAADAIATAADRVQTGLDRTAAAASAAAASSSFDSFDDRYLGPYASDPSLDNDGNALVTGALYFNTTTGLKIWTGATWSIYSAVSGDMLKSDNLSGLANYATARSNMGLTIGTHVQAYDVDLATLAALGNWKVAYTDGSGVQTALSLGADKTILSGNGVSAAPSFRTAANLGILEAAVSASLSAGFYNAASSLGTVTTGTTTLDPTVSNIQTMTNGGASTLAPWASKNTTMVLEITNNGSAGALTTSGWSKVDGDALDTTNAHVFRCYCSVVGSLSHLSVKRMA